ncbi:MAG: PTS sugar transporter subunit IIC [Coprobacillaceae bacterium]
MENFMMLLEAKLMPIAQKVSGKRHMQAIRKGVVATMSLTIVGSIFAILMNIPYEPLAELLAPYAVEISIPYRFTVGVLALYATYGIGANLAKSYKLDGLTGGILATLSFLITVVIPVQVPEVLGEAGEVIVEAGRYMSIASLSASSLFGGIVAAIVSVEIYHFCVSRNITIKMPNGVPPEVGNSFAALFPAFFSILFFWVIRHILNIDINLIISDLLMPLKGFLTGNSLLGGLTTVFLICFFWVLGIHGPAIMAPIIRPFWDVSLAENMEAFANGVSAFNVPNLFTEKFLQWYVWIGGAGCTLALVILFCFSKSKYIKSLGKLSIVPSIFNINEPVIFGAPIVMNPILAIPFIIAPLVATTIAYVFYQMGLIPGMVANVTFTFPAPIAAMMSSNWVVMAAVVSLINFAVSFVIYYPFFKVFEKQELKKELEAENAA